MQRLTDSPAFWILLIVVLVAVYMLPTLIGLIRGVDALALVFVVNLIGRAAHDRVACCLDSRLRPAAFPRSPGATYRAMQGPRLSSESRARLA